MFINPADFIFINYNCRSLYIATSNKQDVIIPATNSDQLYWRGILVVTQIHAIKWHTVYMYVMWFWPCMPHM